MFIALRLNVKTNADLETSNDDQAKNRRDRRHFIRRIVSLFPKRKDHKIFITNRAVGASIARLVLFVQTLNAVTANIIVDFNREHTIPSHRSVSGFDSDNCTSIAHGLTLLELARSRPRSHRSMLAHPEPFLHPFRFPICHSKREKRASTSLTAFLAKSRRHSLSNASIHGNKTQNRKKLTRRKFR